MTTNKTSLIKGFASLIGIIFISLNVWSQSPGGVAGAAAWYRGDLGLTTTQWNDQSGNNYHLTGDNNPVVTNLINFNPVATFNSGASQDYNSSNSAKANWPAGNAAAGFTYYYIARLNDVSTGSRQVALGIGGTTNGFHSGREENALNISASTTAYSPNDASTVRVSTFMPTWGTNSINLIRAGKNAAASAPIYISANGSAEVVSGNLTPNYTNTDRFRIGLAGNDFDRWVGSVGEVIVYSGKHTAANYDRIESYLAIKYGITKAGDYLNSAGSPIWSSTLNAGYLNNIAGIVRDDAGALHQRQSMSVGTLEQVLIGTTGMANSNAANAVNLVDGQSLIWGDNGLSRGPGLKIAGIAGVNYRFAAIWKAQNIGNVGTVRVMWPAIYSSMRLIQSTDATIDASDIVTDMANTQTVNGVSYRYADVTIADGQYFSFAVQFNAPGGVAANLRMWLKSDAGVTTSGSNVTQWSNQTPVIANFVPGNAGLQPSLNSNALNFNPGVNFYPSNSQKSLGWGTGSSGSVASMFGNADPMTFLYVARSTSASGTQTIVQRPSADRPAVEWKNFSSAYRFGLDLDGTDFMDDGYHLTTTIAANTPYILASGFNYQPTATGQIFNTMNGGALHTQNGSTNIAANNEAWSLGSADRTGTAEGFQGEIMEVIGYNAYVNTPATLQKIQSYLALKYGMTLQQPLDYLNSSAAVIWSNGTNTGYTNNIAGIGRDDDGGLYQKQSMSVNAGQQVLIGAGGALANTNAANTNTLTDGQYLVWADNGLGRGVSIPITGFTNVNYRMPAIWKLQNTNTVGTVRVMWPQGLENITLLVSNDAVFTNADIAYPMSSNTQVINGVTYNYADVTFSDGQYFSFLGYLCAPGGFPTGMRLWLKANDGVTTSGSAVTAWGNKASVAASFTPANAGLQPALVSNGLNFNPSVNFYPSGSQRSLRWGTGAAGSVSSMFADTDPMTFIYVARSTNAGNKQTIMERPSGDRPSFEWNNFGGGYRFGMDLDGSDFQDDGYHLATTIAANTPYILTSGFNHLAAGSGGQILNSKNGGALNLQNGNTQLGANSSWWYLGSEDGGTGAGFRGEMMEIIGFNSYLNTPATLQKLHSYLAVKYGMTLEQPLNYISSLDSIVWNASVNSAFNNNIFGIARDFSSCLDQRVSASINAGTIVTVATTNNFTALNSDGSRISMNRDQQYMMLGDNNAAGETQINTPTCPLIIPGDIQINRAWLVQRTNDTSAKFIQVDLSAYSINSNARLMVASDAAFTSNVAVIPAYTFTGGLAVFYVALPKQCYITVVGSQAAPACTACEGGTQLLQNGKIWSAGGTPARTSNTINGAALVGTAAQSGALLANVRLIDPAGVEYDANNKPTESGDYVRLERRDNIDGDAGKMTYSVKLRTAGGSASAKAYFKISAITEWFGTFPTVRVLGYCGGNLVRPVLGFTYTGNPSENAYTINQTTSTMTAFKHGGERDAKSTVSVRFDKIVDSIIVEWTTVTRRPHKVHSNLYIGDMRFVCNNIQEPTPDNISLLATYEDDDLLTCQEAVMALEFTNNNCGSKAVNLQNTLPAGLEYVPASYIPIGSETPTYSGQSFSATTLTIPAGTSVAYIRIRATNPAVGGNYNTQYTFSVPGGLNSPSPYLSDENSGVIGSQQTNLVYTAGSTPSMPTFAVTSVNTVSNDNKYLAGLADPGETLEYTYTFNNTSGAPVADLELTDQLSNDAKFVSSSIVASAGVTYTANNYGGSGEESILYLKALTIPAGISTIKVNANTSTSVDTIRNLANLSNRSAGDCGATIAPLSDSTKIIPLCFRDGLLVPINTSVPVTLSSICNDNGWIYYVNANKKAIIAIRPNGTNWNPDEITIDATPFINKQVNGVLDSAVVMQRLYTIKHAAPISNPVDVRLYYSTAELTGQVPLSAYPLQTWFKHSGTKTNIESELTPTGLAGPNVTDLTPSATGTEFGLSYVQFNGISTFSTFGYKGNTLEVVPVNMVSFTARKQGENAVLDWSTASESNNKGFEVLHSQNGLQFEVVGWVNGIGNSSVLSKYQFIHTNTGKGKHYYRLRQIDFDGVSKLSNIAIVDFGKGDSKIVISPNPAVDNVVVNGVDDFESVSLLDATGKKLYTRKLNRDTQVILKVKEYGKGVFMIVLIRKDGVPETYKLTVL